MKYGFLDLPGLSGEMMIGAGFSCADGIPASGAGKRSASCACALEKFSPIVIARAQRPISNLRSFPICDIFLTPRPC